MDKQAKLAAFGADVLRTMEEAEEWDGELLNMIEMSASSHGLSTADDQGMFRRT